jgi:heme iron utilization protein
MSDPSPEQSPPSAGETTPAEDVRRWLLENSDGVLGTLSADAHSAGHPFLSVVPFALDERGQPLFQLADIAQHTRNALADARTSLLVREPAMTGDPQAGWRVTLLGSLQRVADPEREECFARFVERTPRAREYEATHGFALYRMSVERVRYIGGFGRICWIPGGDVLRSPRGAGAAEVAFAEAAAGSVAHMNDDHAHSLVEMCQGLCGFSPESARMLQMDRTGFLVSAQKPDRLCYFSFGREIDAATIRPAVIGVLKKARGRKAP